MAVLEPNVNEPSVNNNAADIGKYRKVLTLT
jgi:hypothetical protein